MDVELRDWSARGLYERLRVREREGEEGDWAEVERWLDGGGGGNGVVGEREVEGFLRGWREGRQRGWGRREGRERWDEGRVGGWR